MTRFMTSLLILATFLVAPLASSAAPITVPTDLNPGDKFRLAFVTSTTRDATSSDIGDYNTFVAAVAAGQPELAALGTTWTAIGSTEDDDARDNTGTNPFVSTGVPIYRLDDTRIADDNADLWDGNIQSPIQISEIGGILNSDVWTGTRVWGADDGLGLGTSSPYLGTSTANSVGWVENTIALKNDQYALYGMSGVLTVVVPEPGTMVLAAFGFAALAAWGCRRHKRLADILRMS